MNPADIDELHEMFIRLGMICGLGQWRLATDAFGLSRGILLVGRWVEFQVLRMAPSPESLPTNASAIQSLRNSGFPDD